MDCEFRNVQAGGASKASVNHFDSNKIPKKDTNTMSQNDFLRWCLFFCFVFFGQAKKMKGKWPIN